MYPEELKYHKDHMWVRTKGNRAKIGVTYYAQEQLGDIVYIELPEMGVEVDANSVIGEIESTKTTATIEAPVSGKIVELNEELEDMPEIINEDPYGRGWIAVIDMSNPGELDDLMDSKTYQEYIEEPK